MVGLGGYLNVVNWAHSSRLIINSVVAPQMNHHTSKQGGTPVEKAQVELRRSSRQRREPKNDDYFMGSAHLEDLFGQGFGEEDCYGKRRRRNYRYDDSEDYSEGHKYSKKGKLINTNKVETLLDWKFQIDMLPVQVLYLEDESEVALSQFHAFRISKNIAQQNLASLAQDVQALFINIDWGKKGQTLKEFAHLKIESEKLMSKGLAFVWAPKQHVSELLAIMDRKEFTYVENFEIINLDIEKAKEYSTSSLRHLRRGCANEEKREEPTQNEDIDFSLLLKSLEHANPCDLIADQASDYFNSSKRTLLMFKKNSSAKFELRHQRTCDVVFDMPLKLGQKCDQDLKAYIYNMIETLLPDCLSVVQRSRHEFEFKMMELWADKDHYRRGWISVVQE